MTIKDFAQMLNGRDYRKEITSKEERQAEDLGYVVVFGYSDDNVEFRGAIDDEVGCYGGDVIRLTDSGIFEPCECDCQHSKKAQEKCKTIEAVYCGESGYV